MAAYGWDEVILEFASANEMELDRHIYPRLIRRQLTLIAIDERREVILHVIRINYMLEGQV